jgi:hypothetical protein
MSNPLLPHVLGIVVSLGLVSCCTNQAKDAEAGATTPIPLKTALHGFEQDLSALHLAVLSNASNATSGCAKGAPPGCWSKAAQSLLETIKYIQCYDAVPDPQQPKQSKHDAGLRKRNPLVPVANGAVQLQVQGQFSEAGTFTVSATPGVSVALTRQTQQ